MTQLNGVAGNVVAVVAIDGPSGSGKSTMAKRIAEELGILYVDTGAMFRALGFYFDQQGLPLDESVGTEKLIARQLPSLQFEYGKSPSQLVLINGVNLTEQIRQHHVSELASKISKMPIIRQYLRDVQRQLATTKVCVMEGRDIGTVIFPTSFCKIYLTASLETRAKRRFKELEERAKEKKTPFHLTLEEVKKDIAERDARDMSREVAPLKQADDAYGLDSTDLSADQVAQVLSDRIRSQAQAVGIKIP